MAAFTYSLFEDLLLQAKFAPLNQKLKQLDHCQDLSLLIEEGKSYPKEFVLYHLTGYHPRTKDFTELLDNIALIKDLAEYSQQLSRSLKIPAAAMADNYLTHEQLEKKFQVCFKTLQRWRQQGLIGRYLLYPDGKSRLAFHTRVVAHFARKNRKKITASKQFSRLSAQEKTFIINRLSRWSQRCPDCRQEAIQRTAQKFARSRESIRLLLEHWEKQKGETLFEKRSESMSAELQQKICQKYEEGTSISDLTQEYGRSRSNIYRAILLHRSAKLLTQKIDYMGGDYFVKMPLEESRKLLAPTTDFFPGTPTDPLPTIPVINVLDTINSYAQNIAQFSILGPRQEYFLFCQYNYFKFLAAQLQKKIHQQHPRSSDLGRLGHLVAQAQRGKELLICHNLRLVLSTARKHTHTESELMELVSEGNITLLNAVEKFDFTRGTKFSTYATWAIIKRFASLRRGQATLAESLAEDDQLEVVNDGRVADNRVAAIERDRKSLLEAIGESLEERERLVVEYHFGLHEPSRIPGQRKPRSLGQIAELLGLSKERIRQLELSGLQKLRRLLSPEQLELLTQT